MAGLVIALCLLPTTTLAQDQYVTQGKHKSGLQKNEWSQTFHANRWTDFGGIKPFALNGKRSLFFAQLHLKCSQRPDWVKIRLARIHPDGSLDTTGTNTWVLGKTAPKSFQGSLWWESKTKYPIKAQFKVYGGKCYSPQRQLKYWQP